MYGQRLPSGFCKTGGSRVALTFNGDHLPASMNFALGVRLLCFAQLLLLAILLLATGRTWRVYRTLFETIGLGAGILILMSGLSWLPTVVGLAALPSASVGVTLLVLAASEWRFAPDVGQSGFSWAVRAAVRPTLGAAFGATAGFVPILFLRGNPLCLPLCGLALFLGVIAAHLFDRTFVSSDRFSLDRSNSANQMPAPEWPEF